MNSHPHCLVILPTHARSGLVSLVCTTLLVSLLGPARLGSAQAVGPSWSYTGNLNTARIGHTATLLLNGKVLVAGGYDDHTDLNSAELYDPVTGTWSITGNLNTFGGGTATLLPNGKVLITHGLNNPELYDTSSGTWSITGNLNTAGSGTATLLPNGKVLVAGGSDNHSFLNRAELYDPAMGTWRLTGNLNTARVDHTATLLPNGKVLVAGGYSNCSSRCSLNSAELYDPVAGTWSVTGNLNAAPEVHTATLLRSGKVLVASDTGYGELYDPATGTWSDTGNLNTIRYGHTATLLINGKVLVAAGVDSGGDNVLSINNAELYDTTTGIWSYTGSLNTGRASHTMTLLANDTVLVVGGRDYDYDALSSAELFPSSSAVPQITSASIRGKKLFVEGQNFDSGARIILNDEKQKTANGELSATSLLIGKKAGNWIGPGETVRLKVRNSDGTESAEFSFTRPAQ